MITILKISDGVLGGWIVIFLVLVSVVISLAAFLSFKGNRNKKSVLIYSAVIFGIVEICDFIWLIYYFPGGEYFNRELKGMVILLILPLILSCINIFIIARGKKKENNGKVEKSIFIKNLYWLSSFIIFIFLYNFMKQFLYKNDLFFRGWIDKLYFFIGCSFVLLVIIEINYFLYKIMKKSNLQKVLIVLSTIGSIVITPILIFWMIFIYAFNSSPEHKVYEYNRNLIAKVSMGFHNSTVSYYEPFNFMIMRKTDIPEEIYDGSYDRYNRMY